MTALTALTALGRCLGAAAWMLVLLLHAAPLSAAPAYPADSGIVNVRDHGAKGDGEADDTQAIRAAIAAARVDQGRFFWPSRLVYFPAGRYRVSDTIAKRDAQGRYLASMALVGESRDSVQIRLDDRAPGFSDPQRPKPLIYATSTLLDGSPNAGGKDYLGKGEGNDAYGNFVEGMTIDVGSGNPGATGVDFLASNSGAVRHTRIVAGAGSGSVGLAMDRRWPGPLLVADVQVQGFAVGISVSQQEYGVTLEDVALSGQSQVALRNNGNMVALRDVRIDTGAVGLQNLAPEGLVVADRLAVRLTRRDARWADNRGYLTMRGTRVTAAAGAGAGANAPPPRWADNRGYLTMRGTRVTAAAGAGAGANAPSTADGAYLGIARLAPFDAAWRLQAVAAPPAWAPPAERWASVARYGAQPDSGQDATAAIRAAMQSGAEVVYFPAGRYRIADAIEVPPGVRRIAGMFSAISVSADRAPGFTGGSAMLRVATDGAPLTVERLTFDHMGRGPQLAVQHSGARTLVLRDVVTAGTDLARTASGGPLFLENTCCGQMVVAGPSGVWARQFNTEGEGVRIRNEGSPLSILGLKTEQNGTAVQNLAGADTDVLGGLLYIVRPPASPRPAFVTHPQARLAAAYVETVYRDGAAYREHVVVGDDAGHPATPAVIAGDLPPRGRGRVAPGLSIPARPSTP